MPVASIIDFWLAGWDEIPVLPQHDYDPWRARERFVAARRDPTLAPAGARSTFAGAGASGTRFTGGAARERVNAGRAKPEGGG